MDLIHFVTLAEVFEIAWSSWNKRRTAYHPWDIRYEEESAQMGFGRTVKTSQNLL
jgi:hypothetical protein